jgi:hypothetical protein
MKRCPNCGALNSSDRCWHCTCMLTTVDPLFNPDTRGLKRPPLDRAIKSDEVETK